MFRVTTIDVADHERVLRFRRGCFTQILGPGRHRFVHRCGELRLDRYDLTDPEFVHPQGEFLVEAQPELAAALHVFELGEREAGLLYVDGKLRGLVPPASRRFYWKAAQEVRVDAREIGESFELARALVPLVGALRAEESGPHPSDGVLYVEVSDGQVGLLFADGQLDRRLEPGSYAFWRYQRNLKVKFLDTRLQNMEVSGQEILTRDKVSLRINLTASYRILDPEKAAMAVTDFGDLLYKELQFALREAVGTKTLDELLETKDVLNESVGEHVRESTPEYGIEVARVGVKDIILPGEMKNILNQVVEAEKSAQANLIRRREETAATRALQNTARMLDQSPTLLRLKELEALERVTERVDRITVFGGLEGVLQEMVKLRP